MSPHSFYILLVFLLTVETYRPPIGAPREPYRPPVGEQQEPYRPQQEPYRPQQEPYRPQQEQYRPQQEQYRPQQEQYVDNKFERIQHFPKYFTDLLGAVDVEGLRAYDERYGSNSYRFLYNVLEAVQFSRGDFIMSHLPIYSFTSREKYITVFLIQQMIMGVFDHDAGKNILNIMRYLKEGPPYDLQSSVQQNYMNFRPLEKGGREKHPKSEPWNQKPEKKAEKFYDKKFKPYERG